MKPRLVYSAPDGRMTVATLSEEASIEARVRRDEARQHVAHLKLLAKQLVLFSPETFQRLLVREAERYGRKWDDGERAA